MTIKDAKNVLHMQSCLDKHEVTPVTERGTLLQLVEEGTILYCPFCRHKFKRNVNRD